MTDQEAPIVQGVQPLPEDDELPSHNANISTPTVPFSAVVRDLEADIGESVSNVDEETTSTAEDPTVEMSMPETPVSQTVSTTMKEIRPPPRIKNARKRSGRGGKSTILTSTPEKDKLIATMIEKNEKAEELKRKKIEREEKRKEKELRAAEKGTEKAATAAERAAKAVEKSNQPKKSRGRPRKIGHASTSTSRTKEDVKEGKSVQIVLCPGCEELYIDPPVRGLDIPLYVINRF